MVFSSRWIFGWDCFFLAKTQRRKAFDRQFFDKIFKKELSKSPERVSSKGMGEAHVLKITKNWQPCMGVIRYCGVAHWHCYFLAKSQRRKAFDRQFFDKIFKKEPCNSPERVPSKGMGEAHVLKITKNWQPCMGVIRLAVLYVVW